MEEITPPSQHHDGEATDPEDFDTLVILEFKPDINQAAVEWFLSKVEAPRANDGGELMAQITYDDDGNVRVNG